MAEALLLDIIKDRTELSGSYTAQSAGVYAYEGDPASKEAVRVMKDEFGIDIASHRAKVLDDKDIREAYLILSMTERHRQMILDVYPEAADKLYTLYGFINKHTGKDIRDPYGLDYAAYKECALEIESILIDIIEQLSN